MLWHCASQNTSSRRSFFTTRLVRRVGRSWLWSGVAMWKCEESGAKRTTVVTDRDQNVQERRKLQDSLHFMKNGGWQGGPKMRKGLRKCGALRSRPPQTRRILAENSGILAHPHRKTAHRSAKVVK